MTLNIFCNKKKTKTKKQLNFAIFVSQGRIIGLVSHWLLSSRFSLNFGKRMNCKDPEGTGFCFVLFFSADVPTHRSSQVQCMAV